MTPRFQDVLKVNNVTPGKKASIEIEPGDRLLQLNLTGQADGQEMIEIIDEMKIYVDGVEQRTFTADELDKMNQFRASRFAAKRATTAGAEWTLPIFFYEPDRVEYAARFLPAWPTGDLEKLLITVEIKDTADASVNLRANLSSDSPLVDGAPLAMGNIVKWARDTHQVTSTALTIKNLLRRDLYQQIDIFDEDIASFSVVVNGVDLIRNIAFQDWNDYMTDHDVIPPSDRLVIPFDLLDFPTNGLPMTNVREFYIKLVLSDGTPRDIVSIAQRFGPRE